MGCCAVEFCCGQSAADGGNDDSGGYKAHGCDLLVKRTFSAHPFPGLQEAVVGCHSFGLEMLDCCFLQCEV